MVERYDTLVQERELLFLLFQQGERGAIAGFKVEEKFGEVGLVLNRSVEWGGYSRLRARICDKVWCEHSISSNNDWVSSE